MLDLRRKVIFTARQELERRKRLWERKEKAEASLIEFIRMFWHCVEPEKEFVEGWALGAICEHLESVTNGDIKRLIMNVPPGFSKSLSTDVFWSAWEWGPRNMPSMRYICTSSQAYLTERDNGRFLRVITDPVYQKLWGNRFQLDLQGVSNITNKQTGWKLATTVGGISTGARGNRVICFPYDELVLTDKGSIRIGDIVENRISISVPSFNVFTGKIESKPITGWIKNGGSPIVEVMFSDGARVRCTPDHKIWTTNHGWIEAEKLQSSDVIPCFPRFYTMYRIFVNAVFLAQKYLWLRTLKNVFNIDWCKFTVTSNLAVCRFSKSICNDPPRSSGSNCVYSSLGNGISLGKNCTGIITQGYSYGFFVSEFGILFLLAVNMCLVVFTIGNILNTGSIGEVIKPAICAASIFMPNLLAFSGFSNKGKHDGLMNPEFSFLAKFINGIKKWISVTSWRWLHNKFFIECISLPPSFANSAMAFYVAKIGRTINSFISEDRFPVFIREIGHVDFTYCLNVEGNHTFYAGDSKPLLVKNCDDPNSTDPKKNESEIQREGINGWLMEVMPDRLNSLEEDAIILIQQRTHESDATATLLDRGQDYFHLCIPMEYDSQRHCETEIGWSDPRSEEGELAWSERFSPEVIRKMKIEKGPVAYAGQYQQSPITRGGNIIKQDWWKLYDLEYAKRLGLIPQGGEKLMYPSFDLVVVSVDTALTEKKENCYSGCTVWGIWKDEKDLTKLMLVYAWQERLQLHGVSPLSGDTEAQKRAKEGLVEKIARTASPLDKGGITPHGASVILVENKANGPDVINELARLYRNRNWQLVPIDPKGDKVARTHAAVPTFTQGLIYAPDKEWAQKVINQMASFPRGKDKDLHDCAIQAILWMRNYGAILRPDEEQELLESRLRPHGEESENIYEA